MHMNILRLLGACLLALPAMAQITKSVFIAEPSPTPSVHASTIAEAKAGLTAAWFGGAAEGSRDVTIWFTRQQDDAWLKPVILARGDEDGDEIYPCWNPVLFQPKNGPLYLFYKVGPKPSSWWGRVKRSDDGGLNWAQGSHRLPGDILGPIKNKPVELANGMILCGSSTEDQGWRVHFEWTRDPFQGPWRRTGPLHAAMELGAIQPTILAWEGGRLQMLCRTKEGFIYDGESTDFGVTWTRPHRTTLPNPNSGFDGVVLQDGRGVLVYNPTTRGRGELVVALSESGRTWNNVLTLEKSAGEFSYPAVIQDQSGMIHITYTWKREKIKHVVVDPKLLK
jgi:predicted neuraminidase